MSLYNVNKALFDFPGLAILKLDSLENTFNQVPPFTNTEIVLEYDARGLLDPETINSNPGYTPQATPCTYSRIVETPGFSSGCKLYQVPVTFRLLGTDLENSGSGWQVITVFEAFKEIYLIAGKAGSGTDLYRGRQALFRLNSNNEFIYIPVPGYENFSKIQITDSKTKADLTIATVNNEVVVSFGGFYSPFGSTVVFNEHALLTLRFSETTIVADYILASSVTSQDTRINSVFFNDAEPIVSVNVGDGDRVMSKVSISAPTLTSADYPVPVVTENGSIHYLINGGVNYGYPYNPFANPRRRDGFNVPEFREGIYGRDDFIEGVRHRSFYTGLRTMPDIAFNITNTPSGIVKITEGKNTIVQADGSYLTSIAGNVTCNEGQNVSIIAYLHRASISARMTLSHLHVNGVFQGTDSGSKLAQNRELTVSNKLGDLYQIHPTLGVHFLPRAGNFPIALFSTINQLYGETITFDYHKTIPTATNYGFVSFVSNTNAVFAGSAENSLLFTQAAS